MDGRARDRATGGVRQRQKACHPNPKKTQRLTRGAAAPLPQPRRSPHPMQTFGCTICHQGQGSATSFKWSSHSPNTPKQGHEWHDEHGWFNNHHWILPMLPDRFELRGDPIVTVELNYVTEIGWLAGRGYNLCDVKFEVTYHAKSGPVNGTLVLVRWENLCDPILSGREELGHNKLYCEIPEPRFVDERHSVRTRALPGPTRLSLGNRNWTMEFLRRDVVVPLE